MIHNLQMSFTFIVVKQELDHHESHSHCFGTGNKHSPKVVEIMLTSLSIVIYVNSPWYQPN